MRLDKLLANMGYGTRKEIKKLAKQGIITVNGEVAKDTSLHVDPQADRIEIAGEKVAYRKYVYLMLHKPQGFISATEDPEERTVIDLLPEKYLPFKPFPVGRLDKDTEGLLILTNDGKLAHNLLSPKKHVPKTYYADVLGEVTKEDVIAFKKGVVLDDGYETLPAELNILHVEKNGMTMLSKIKITIFEGKYHQVKRMFAAVGKKVTYLKRIAMGNLRLDPRLHPGEVRELSEEELKLLQQTRTNPV
ncbi:pseudouridine synthase [Bacillaceae bacterium]